MWSPSDCIRLGGEHLHQARIVEKRIALIARIRALGCRFRLGGSGRSLRLWLPRSFLAGASDTAKKT